MAIEINTQLKSNIQKKADNRLDSKFYVVEDFFRKLQKKSNCKVDSLENLDWNVSSGSYIENYISEEEGTPYVRVGNIKPFSLNEQKASLVYVSKKLPKKIQIEKDDILLGRTQATTEKLGVASIADDSNKGFVISQHVMKLFSNSNKLSPFYLIAYLNSKFYKLQTDIASHGDTRVELTHSQVKNLKVFIPESNVVSSVERNVKQIINLNQSMRSRRNEIKKFILNSLKIKLKKIVNQFDVNFKTIDNFGIWNAKSHMPNLVEVEKTIVKNFKTISLGEIADIGIGFEPGSKNYNTEKFKLEGDPAFIRTSDINNNDIDVFPDYFISKDLPVKEKNKVIPGEIVFSKDGIIGEVAMVSKFDKIILASGFAKIRINKNGIKLKLTPEYLFALLSMVETGFLPAIRRTVIAATIPHLRPDRLKEIRIPILKGDQIDKLTTLVKKFNQSKDLRKELILRTIAKIDKYFLP